MHEFRRLLTDNGHVILSVPFLITCTGHPTIFIDSHLYGIRYLAERAGFESLHMHTSGGFAHSVCTQQPCYYAPCYGQNASHGWSRFQPVLLETLARLVDALTAWVSSGQTVTCRITSSTMKYAAQLCQVLVE